jgi:DNA (cytosine-5)-methyltransferase 1
MRFVDLFAGLGGFHLALQSQGHECVFACEIDERLRLLYESNFGVTCGGDIRGIAVPSVPSHDILCAGFPCQPFSKAGTQEGFGHPRWGDLWSRTLAIIVYHRPTYLILENVANLEAHNGGRTWATIRSQLEEVGYQVGDRRLSPHQFGIPQIRDRLFIVGSKVGLNGFSWPQPARDPKMDITRLLDCSPVDAKPLGNQATRCLAAWQLFLSRFPEEKQFPSFPLWSMEFGATYPFEDETPFSVGEQQLRSARGSHGRALTGLSGLDLMRALPSHARTQERVFPDWKVRFIRKNRELYETNRRWIDDWLPSILEFPSSLQKLEWNCNGDDRNLWTHIVQFRASGVRVKRPTTAPALVAMNTTQVPVVAWERRYMTPRECARLQSMDGISQLPEPPASAFRALGNAVNVDLVRKVAAALIRPAQPLSLAEPEMDCGAVGCLAAAAEVGCMCQRQVQRTIVGEQACRPIRH